MLLRLLCSLTILLPFVGISPLAGQNHPAYRLYNAKGKKVSYKKMLRHLEKADIILFGEYHNDPIAHWLQLEVTEDLHPRTNLTLGAEMFEADNQALLTAYLNDQITETELDSLARLWSNYTTDYAPLVNFAKKNQRPFVATNIPRRYATQLFREGIEPLYELPDSVKAWMVPLPFVFEVTLPGYRKMLEMANGNENFPKAQAIKDATMAYFILKNYKKGDTFLHFNGAFHSDNYEGILWYLQRDAPHLKYATITTVLQKEIRRLEKENKQKADFIICVPENMTRTF